MDRTPDVGPAALNELARWLSYSAYGRGRWIGPRIADAAQQKGAAEVLSAAPQLFVSLVQG